MATTRNRVPAHSPEAANERIRRETAASVAHFAMHQDGIPKRLQELDREWDIERRPAPRGPGSPERRSRTLARDARAGAQAARGPN